MNTELLLKVADAIEKYPELYDQATYSEVEVKDTSCETTACIAGWACALEGYYPTVAHSAYSDDKWLTYESVSKEPWTDYSDGVHPHYTAASLLGLNYSEADDLFADCWTPLGDLTVPQALREIANGTPLMRLLDDCNI
jgi:hypothetical protein